MARQGIIPAERVLKALANRRRLSMLLMLHAKGAASVGHMAEHVRLSFAATSRHLRVLSTAGLVETDQVNTTVNYSLAKNRNPFLDTILRNVA